MPSKPNVYLTFEVFHHNFKKKSQEFLLIIKNFIDMVFMCLSPHLCVFQLWKT